MTSVMHKNGDHFMNTQIVSKIILVALVLLYAGCFNIGYSGGRICFPFCKGKGEEFSWADDEVWDIVQELVHDIERRARTVTYVFNIRFNRSILTSVDAFFSRYNSNHKDERLIKSIKKLSRVGYKIIEKHFGVYPEVTYKPNQKKYELYGKPSFSPWVEKDAKDAPDLIKNITPKNGEIRKIRWRLRVIPLFKYNVSDKSTIHVSVLLTLQIEGRKEAGSEFKPVAYNTKLFEEFANKTGKAVFFEYVKFFKTEYDLEVMEKVWTPG